MHSLTVGRPVPAEPFHWARGEAAVALALAQASRHPLARALASAIEAEGVTAAEVRDLAEEAGKGVSARVGGKIAYLGRPDWLGLDDATGSGLVTAFSVGPGTARVLRFHDALRPGAATAVERMTALGLAPMLISGDREAAVRAIAEPLGMEWRSSLTPQCKYAAIDEWQSSGRRVLMVGDGLNDGPALKAAHVSIAPSSASDVGQSAADLLFLGDQLAPVPIAIAAARRTMRVIRQNFWLAIGYNVLAVPLAIGGLVTPLIAALAMSASSLLVVGNALRLRTCAR